jgi:UDP-N-acetylglucosamine--N-acetylmuramyl-(pentapeptide) pyrophosphoryl-undecaprenol N-acetylglucosamine transferase
MKKILIMAGGTGGHVFPALAVAQQLQQQGVEVTWLGTRRGIEAQLVPAAGIHIHYISVAGLRGKSKLSLLWAPVKLSYALWQSLRIIWRLKPQVVLGLGGFAAGPGGLAAWLLARPLVIHEQNAVAGLTNRILAPLAKQILTAFPGVFSGSKTKYIGNPVRPEICALASPQDRFQRGQGPLKLLVLGGSLGAQRLNQRVAQAVAALPLAQRPDIYLQTGKRHWQQVKDDYQQQAVQAKLVPFIEDMAAAYGWADVVLCRAGALTIAELAAVGVGALLVPYPYAVDDHQTVNSQYLVKAGAAILLPQAQLTVDRLKQVLIDLAIDRSRLLSMAQAARKLARPQATEQLVQACLAFINPKVTGHA